MFKHLFVFLLLLTSAQAEEFRFQCQGEVTGLCDQVFDAEGKATLVRFDFANRKVAAVFKALQTKRIYGTQGMEDHEGVSWEQAIYLTGEFTSELSSGASPFPEPEAPCITEIKPHPSFFYCIIRVKRSNRYAQQSKPGLPRSQRSCHSLIQILLKARKRSAHIIA